ncbi:hypothetical protein V1277_000685 [Bradyrhizobium sp. AZCC 1588]|uniref:hypothetical protein n=1 Tax=unclassified Bradyrhizobium TaxID=2631580 RepID=UPI002FF0C331
METLEAYLDRKYEEITLLNGFLETPLALQRPTSVAEVIEQKFHIAAALKAQHALHDWAFTETAWAHPGRLRAGPFTFSYDYQRANLEVRGPSFYDHSTSANQTIYTSSGMAAISALLLAFARLASEADILVLPGAYGETLELIENHARQFRLVPLKSSPDEVAGGADQPRILLFDSCTPAAAFEATLRCARPRLDLVIFDTTCFSTGSGRIRRVVSWARRWEVPIALVRSHTKLDSLGVEYGRLGSVVFVACEKHVVPAKQERLEDLANETRNAVRLFGGAAVPAHFPPYVGTKAYQALTDRRMAAILRNSRRTARCFASGLAGSSAELHFAHGLYVTLAPKRMLDEKQTKQVAANLCDDLRRAGLPLRHAGSFGFDFGAAEWFRDTARNRHVVRIAVPDLPTLLWDQVARAVVEWWSAHEGEPEQPYRADDRAYSNEPEDVAR